MATLSEPIIANAQAAARCDRCHARRGVRFFDHFWVCVPCAWHYWQLLESERLRASKWQ
jgi:hypothetical protein